MIFETIKKHRNYVVNLDKKSKLQYFSKFISNRNKSNWVKCKLCFINKVIKTDTDIVLNENRELVLKNKEVLNSFNDHFGSIVGNLSLDHREDHSYV